MLRARVNGVVELVGVPWQRSSHAARCRLRNIPPAQYTAEHSVNLSSLHLQAAVEAAKAEAEEQAELVRGNPLLQEKLAAQGKLLLAVVWSSWLRRRLALRTARGAGEVRTRLTA